MSPEAPSDLLNAAYTDLGYDEAKDTSLLPASGSASGFPVGTWVEKGDWLALAKEVGAERLFFLDNNPVIVFAGSQTDDQQAVRRLYHRAWSMARPRLLFLAKPGELAVYDLASRPPRTDDDLAELDPLAVARSAAEVAEKLNHFRREQIETGRVFAAEERFGTDLGDRADKTLIHTDLSDRADKALIHDLKAVRHELIGLGLAGKEKLKFAHALIGRSIFIRYLEDRGVLTPNYFRDAAKGHPEWAAILREQAPLGLWLEPDQNPPLYPRVLSDHAFTYALFRKLAKDFNGDMFPNADEEALVVGQQHLNLIRDLMYGDVGIQKKLFFGVYRFNIIPIELISSIYEEFYHEESGKGRAHGAFYTPPALVDFLLSQVLTLERLEPAPRIVDPACGSGIFLVEAFRRIVRYRVARQGRRLRFAELQKIVRDQLAGIDVNPEAIRVAAFSLYLAMLHYLEPRDILKQLGLGNKLPCLVADDANPGSFGSLVAANAFRTELLTSRPELKQRFSSQCADIVVSNPPWGSPGIKDKAARDQNQIALDWCERRGLPVGDRERSQTFIWRALDLLKRDGTAGLLVSTGIFFKHGSKSKSPEFRREWLSESQLEAVVNFAHARQVFFKSAISPFASVVFRKAAVEGERTPIRYWSPKRTRMVEGLQAILLSAPDLHVIAQDHDPSDHSLWKTLWWGNHRDLQLVSYLRSFELLASLTTPEMKGQGYKEANKRSRALWLKKYKALPIEHFRRYGPIDWSKLAKVPEKVESRGVEAVYSGMRLLVGRGIDESGEPKGQIVARLEDRPFAFTNAIHGVKLPKVEEREHRIVLGVLWSSLARYFWFLTSSNWGIWHHEIQLDHELLGLPIRFPKDPRLEARILGVVDELREHTPQPDGQLPFQGAAKAITPSRVRELEVDLDGAVFELYGLGEEEVDLVRDLCDTGMEFFYGRDESEAVKPVLPQMPTPGFGTAESVSDSTLGHYLRTFIGGWSSYLGADEELRWQVHMPPQSDSMIAAAFTVHEKGDAPQQMPTEQNEWARVLTTLDKALRQPISSRIYIEGLVRAVTDDSILIVKRNERRLWTKSMAREDAEATLVQAMNRQSARGESWK
jgi:hypothetical protein